MNTFSAFVVYLAVAAAAPLPTEKPVAASGVSVDAISQALYGGWGGSKAIYKRDEAPTTEKTKDKTTNDGVTVDSISLALYGGWGGSKAIYKKDKASSQAGN